MAMTLCTRCGQPNTTLPGDLCLDCEDKGDCERQRLRDSLRGLQKAFTALRNESLGEEPPSQIPGSAFKGVGCG